MDLQHVIIVCAYDRRTLIMGLAAGAAVSRLPLEVEKCAVVVARIRAVSSEAKMAYQTMFSGWGGALIFNCTEEFRRALAPGTHGLGLRNSAAGRLQSFFRSVSATVGSFVIGEIGCRPRRLEFMTLCRGFKS